MSRIAAALATAAAAVVIGFLGFTGPVTALADEPLHCPPVGTQSEIPRDPKCDAHWG